MRDVLPADSNRTIRIEDTPRDKLVLLAEDLDLGARLGVARDAFNRGHEDPGVTRKERAGPPRLEDDPR